jgi:hypothetical protein
VRAFGTMFFSMGGRSAAQAEEQEWADAPSSSLHQPETKSQPRRWLIPLVLLPIIPAALVLAPIVIGRFFFQSIDAEPSSYSEQLARERMRPPPPANPLPLDGWDDVEVEDRRAFYPSTGPDPVLHEKVRKIMEESDRDYLKLEAANTRWDITPTGVLRLGINPFPREINQLENRTWGQIEKILTRDRVDQLRSVGIYSNVYGRKRTDIEIERTNQGFTWTVYTARDALKTHQDRQYDTRLPRRLERYWLRLIGQ